MLFSIDRIENGFAVCIPDEGETVNIDISLIDGAVREGDIICPDGNGKYTVDIQEGGRRRELNYQLAESLFDE